jgi:hypothetical protein
VPESLVRGSMIGAVAKSQLASARANHAE